jgi:peroxiredoxin
MRTRSGIVTYNTFFVSGYHGTFIRAVLTIFALSVVVLCKAQLPERAEDISPLLIGEIVPDATLIDLKGEHVQTSTVFAAKPTVLIIYRGGWCPFCNRHLAEIGQITEQINALGYQIVAVSPDVMAGLREETITQESLSYTLLADAGGRFCKGLGIAVRAPERYTERLHERSGSVEIYLPVPAVFVLNEAGEILFEHISPNYKQRMPGKLLLAVLDGLKA